MLPQCIMQYSFVVEFIFRKRKAQEEEEDEQKKKIQKEWDKNYEVCSRWEVIFLRAYQCVYQI